MCEQARGTVSRVTPGVSLRSEGGELQREAKVLCGIVTKVTLRREWAGVGWERVSDSLGLLASDRSGSVPFYSLPQFPHL